jgi:hypothetical protein
MFSPCVWLPASCLANLTDGPEDEPEEHARGTDRLPPQRRLKGGLARLLSLFDLPAQPGVGRLRLGCDLVGLAVDRLGEPVYVAVHLLSGGSGREALLRYETGR